MTETGIPRDLAVTCDPDQTSPSWLDWRQMGFGIGPQIHEDPGAYPFDLGSYSRSVSTSSSAARRWFDHGLIWSYAFNHEEAIACFERSIAVDPEFAMAHWGIAYAAGPNYNKQWDA